MQHLESAPGAQAAKHCGIWSIIAACTCVGVPIAILLAIIALIKHGKAKKAALEAPDYYAMPNQTAMVTAIIGLVLPVLLLPFIGIVSAIAIPALLGQRSRARDKAAISNLLNRQSDLIAEFDKLNDLQRPPSEIVSKLEASMKRDQAEHNPWAQPGDTAAFEFHIQVVEHLEASEIENLAIESATTLGRPVFVLEFPTKGDSGYLAGAVRLQNRVNDHQIYAKTQELLP